MPVVGLAAAQPKAPAAVDCTPFGHDGTTSEHDPHIVKSSPPTLRVHARSACTAVRHSLSAAPFARAMHAWAQDRN